MPPKNEDLHGNAPDKSDVARLLRAAGFDHHPVKPVDPQALMKLLAGLQAVKA